MINAVFYHDKIVIRGHAPREDARHPSIVCAAVSAAVQTVLTGLELAGNEGAWTAPEEYSGEIVIDKRALRCDPQTAFMLGLLYVQLEKIAQAAPEALKVTDKRKN